MARVNVAATTDALDAVVAAVHEATNETVAAAARKLRDRAQELAPKESGDLAQSIEVDSSGVRSYADGAVSVFVGPTAPYGRRVDMGFRGRDSAGRSYREDRGDAFFRRAADEIVAEFEGDIVDAWGRAMGRS